MGVKKYLIEVEGFVPYKENAFVLVWKERTQVDLIPFGDLEKEGVVTVKGTGFTSMNVEGVRNGLDELLARKLDYTIEFCRSLISHIISGIKDTSGNNV